MSKEGKQNIIQIATFLRSPIQGMVRAKSLLKKTFGTVGDTVVLRQSGPPLRETLPFDGVENHGTGNKSEGSGHGTIR